MLTKTLKFNDDVLSVLRGMKWQEDGRLAKITTQLDRALYVSVNKALEAMGGKWNRSAGGHVFSDDPRSQVKGLINSGNITIEKDGFFQTPAALAERMVQLANIQPGDSVLEPSAGLGAIASQIWRVHPELDVCEANPDRANFLVAQGYKLASLDFIWYSMKQYDKIIMNPPFEECQDIDHVLHAFSLLKPSGRIVAIMSNHWTFANDKKSIAFREWFTGDIEALPPGTFKESGTGVNAVLVVIYN